MLLEHKPHKKRQGTMQKKIGIRLLDGPKECLNMSKNLSIRLGGFYLRACTTTTFSKLGCCQPACPYLITSSSQDERELPKYLLEDDCTVICNRYPDKYPVNSQQNHPTTTLSVTFTSILPALRYRGVAYCGCRVSWLQWCGDRLWTNGLREDL